MRQKRAEGEAMGSGMAGKGMEGGCRGKGRGQGWVGLGVGMGKGMGGEGQ